MSADFTALPVFSFSSRVEPPTSPSSPCIRVCTLDDDRVCIGCGRHVDEITAWTRLTALEQSVVCERSAQRRAKRLVEAK